MLELELDQEGINKRLQEHKQGINKRLQEHKQRVREGEEKKLLEQTETDPNALPQRGILIRAWSRIREIFGGRDTIQTTFDAYKTREARVEKIREASGLASNVGRETQEKITSAGQTAERMGLDASAETTKLTMEERTAETELDREVDELAKVWFEEGEKVSAEVESGRIPSSNLELSSAPDIIAKRREQAGKAEQLTQETEPMEMEEKPTMEIPTRVTTPMEEAPTTEQVTKQVSVQTDKIDMEDTRVFTPAEGETETKVESERVEQVVKQFLDKAKELGNKIDKLPNSGQNLKNKLNALLDKFERDALINVYKTDGLDASHIAKDEKIMLDQLTEYNADLTAIEQQVATQEKTNAEIAKQIDNILRHLPEQIKSQITSPEEQRKLADEARQLLHEWNQADTAKSGGDFVDHFSNPRQLEQAGLQALKIREQERSIRQDNAEALANLTREETTAIVTEARKKIFSWDEADRDKPGFTSHFDNPQQRQEAARQVMAERAVRPEEKIATKKKGRTAEEEATTQVEEYDHDEEQQLEGGVELETTELSAVAGKTANFKKPAIEKETTKISVKSAAKEIKSEDGSTDVDVDMADADTEVSKTDGADLQTIRTDLLNADQAARNLQFEAKGLGGEIEKLADDYLVDVGMLMKRREAIAKSPADNTEALAALKTDSEKMQAGLLQLELKIKTEQLKKDANQSGNKEIFKEAEKLANRLQKIRPVHEDALVEDVKIFAKDMMKQITKLREKLAEDTDTDRDTINDVAAMRRHQEVVAHTSESDAQLDWNEYEPAEGEEDKVLDTLGFSEDSSLIEIANFRRQLIGRMDKLAKTIADNEKNPNVSTNYEKISLRVLKNVDELLYRAQLLKKETKTAAA